ncbi:MAG: CDP-alcohol phosphatidyltransferase family protein [Chlamydiae bacterium]|nr:CDP-alcohol phosphatidyltransferase family protein [Chlamydiota bacterium]
MNSIYFYWPNIIGYARLILLFLGMFIALNFPLLAAIFFILNLIFDALDGYLARAFKQSTAFGAVLDYSTDRISLAGYIILLSQIYPKYQIVFFFLLSLDLACHFFHWKACEGKASHKEMGCEEMTILRLYYNRVVLGATCLLHDLFFILLFLSFFYTSSIIDYLMKVCFVGVVYKTLVHVMKIVRSSHILSLRK